MQTETHTHTSDENIISVRMAEEIVIESTTIAPCNSELKRVAAVFNGLHRLGVSQWRSVDVCDGRDDVTGLELWRRHAASCYLYTPRVSNRTFTRFSKRPANFQQTSSN